MRLSQAMLIPICYTGNISAFNGVWALLLTQTYLNWGGMALQLICEKAR